ncbi:MAG: hypothetical protein U0470_11695 [Anaerolineae bacterium]
MSNRPKFAAAPLAALAQAAVGAAARAMIAGLLGCWLLISIWRATFACTACWP